MRGFGELFVYPTELPVVESLVPLLRHRLRFLVLRVRVTAQQHRVQHQDVQRVVGARDLVVLLVVVVGEVPTGGKLTIDPFLRSSSGNIGFRHFLGTNRVIKSE